MSHIPVLLQACLDGLAIKSDGIYLDGTLGRGGHSAEIAKRLTTGKLICIDRDETAFAGAQDKLAPYMDCIHFAHSNFSEFDTVLQTLGYDAIDGMLFDLGVSSPQLDEADRGFSYMHDAPLDMRMNRQDNLTAHGIVNNYAHGELARIFRVFGEERFASPVASAILRAREKQEIVTTLELVEIIKSAMPASALREKQHPAKRCFQALRMAVNDELAAVESVMRKAPRHLNSGGRLCVISFHSLEDRIVKNGFTEAARGCTCPSDFPVCVCGNTPLMTLVRKKPITASIEELELNPRSRSAKLRVGERR